MTTKSPTQAMNEFLRTELGCEVDEHAFDGREFEAQSRQRLLMELGVVIELCSQISPKPRMVQDLLQAAFHDLSQMEG